MQLTRQKKFALRDLGWILLSERGKSPDSVAIRNVLEVGGDVRFDDDAPFEAEEFVDLETMV